MDEKTYRITLADGTILDNLTMNGNNFISEGAIDASIFDGTCSPVIINDGTNEGFRYVGKKIFTVQFHPEASPGPLDTGWLFDRFLDMMRGE